MNQQLAGFAPTPVAARMENHGHSMVKVAMQGKPPMPPKGGAANASEDDIRAAVQYMVDAAK